MAEEHHVKLLRNLAIISFIVAMGLILYAGSRSFTEVPPIPQKIVAQGQAQPLTDADAIWHGQQTYQRYGLMDHGSLWGHGTLRGMDFAADTLHQTGVWMRDFYADEQGRQAGSFDRLDEDRRAAIDRRVIKEIKANRYDPGSRSLTLSAAQAYAFEQNRSYWDTRFDKGEPDVGFLPGTVKEAKERRDLADFFFWAAWAAGANRPNLDYTYTSNWPADRSVGNGPTASAFLWSFLAILGLLAVLGVVVYVVHRYHFFYGPARGAEAAYALMETPLTRSQRAAAKFFLIAVLLFLVQILNGGLLANYTVRPAQFYVQTVGNLYPYSWAKTWHVQLAILWISTAWVGTAVYVAPLISRREPRGQSILVNLLFWALIIVAVGSLVGEVMSIKGMLGGAWFWIGHQGWEYLELGRLWQWLLFLGLIFWLIIVYRTLAGAIRSRPQGEAERDTRSLVVFYVLAAILVVAFFGFGLLYGRNTHLTIADYWRWFVVHIWVESIFEFFGVAVVALFLVTLGLVTPRSALRVAYLTAILVFFGGITGVAHHYYWFGGPGFWQAFGGVFSSLEVIPLILLVVRAWMEYRHINEQGGQFPYRWPLYFLVASSVWNFVGAAIFGFIMNLPIINYYTHSTYMTSNHAHTALFGTYGMLAIALALFSWRGLVRKDKWSDGVLKFSFWSLNIGLVLMFTTTLLPIGLMQAWGVYTDGFWHARGPGFYSQPVVKLLAEWRIVPDTIIIVFGALPLLWFIFRTFFSLRKVGEQPTVEEIEGKPR